MVALATDRGDYTQETSQGQGGDFAPGAYMIQLPGRKGNADYLPVAARLAWFRSEYPQGTLDLEHIVLTDQLAVFKAVIETGLGGRATGYGSESPADFRDYIEKASTKAIGRALSALGFGTMEAGEEMAEGVSQSTGELRIVDAPVDFTRGNSGRGSVAAKVPPRQGYSGGGDQGASIKGTERQVKFVYALAGECRMDEQELGDWAEELYGERVIEQLNRRDISTLIESLQRRRQDRG